MLLAPWFAIAGVAAAAGLVLIHLLNRRRYKLVQWAAMDFLREAVIRSRRIPRLRDLVLLTLRCACLLAFGLAMARPLLTGTGALRPNQPVHAVILVDNSLSMGFQTLEGTLLDRARTRAGEIITGLPRGSRISVLPTCGPSGDFSFDAYFSPEDAAEALDSFEVVDRAMRPRAALDLALEACRRVPGMPQKRVYLITDPQAADWTHESLAEHLEKIPGGLQVVEIETDGLENAWVADFQLRDGVGDLQAPAVFIATVGYVGESPRRDVQVTLTVDGAVVAVQAIAELQSGQTRQITFPPYRFNVAAESGKPVLVPAEVTLSEDRLPADDRRVLVAPVLASLPVVFVDQYGQQEDLRLGRYGETFHLRRWLAPVTSHAAGERQPIRIRHLGIDQLDRRALEDARLVVVAGVAGPETTVPLLREYVEQGGNLLIATGSQFDPARWTQDGWLDGLGILPAPLEPATVGRLPEQTPDRPEWFQLDFQSLKDHPYFALPGVSAPELEDLYRQPYFFKAVAVDLDEEVQQAAGARIAEHWQRRREEIARIDARLGELARREARAPLAPAEQDEADRLRARRAELLPAWLRWAGGQTHWGPTGAGGNFPGTAVASDPNGRAGGQSRNGPTGGSAAPGDALSGSAAPAGIEPHAELPAEQLARYFAPRVPARYTNGLPFLVERRWGRGRVLLMTTGILPEWNTLAVTQTMLIFDRILRGMILETLPERNLETHQSLVLPVGPHERHGEFRLIDPQGRELPLAVDALGGDRFGIRVPAQAHRGIYRVVALRAEDSTDPGLESKLWEVPLAVNGPAEESRLPGDEAAAGPAAPSELRSGDSTRATRATVVRGATYGTGLWKWILAAVLAGLLGEMWLLAWPALAGERTA